MISCDNKYITIEDWLRMLFYVDGNLVFTCGTDIGIMDAIRSSIVMGNDGLPAIRVNATTDTFFILTEDGNYVLLENGDKILIE